MRKIQYPSIYKHFKDRYYATMGVSKPVDMTLFDFKVKYMNAKHTESSKSIIIITANDGSLVHDRDEEKKDLVLYKSLYDETGIYARPMCMFLSEVDKGKHPNAVQRYRFELAEVKKDEFV